MEREARRGRRVEGNRKTGKDKDEEIKRTRRRRRSKREKMRRR